MNPEEGNMKVTRIACLGASLIALGVTDEVRASAAAPAPQAQDTGQPPAIGDIVVTARQRSESLKNVPIAVTAVTGDALKKAQIYQLREIATIAPGLNITTDSPARAFISIRGIGITLIDSVQPGVGVFIDGVYQPNTGYLNSPLVDVERVEVLRGPQGTLFGNNTLAGAINVITRQPGNQFEGRVDMALAGPDNSRSVSGSLSGPIIEDGLQIRVGAAYHAADGFMKDKLVGGDANPLEQKSVNTTIRAEPTSWATFTVNANRDWITGGNTPYVDATGPTDYSLDTVENQRRLVHVRYTGANVKGEFDAAPISTKITLIGAFNEKRTISDGDGDYGAIDYLRSYGHERLRSYTGEARFDTKWTDHISTLIGGYINHISDDNQGITTVVAANLDVPSSGTSTNNFKAVFGTLFWKFDPTFDLAIGLRYDHQELRSSSAGQAAAYKANNVEPRITLTKHWTPDVMTYASVAKGVRGGGQNSPGAPNLIFRGDSVWTYEVGSKLTALDRKLSLNADVFYNDYSNFIGPNGIAPSTTGAGFVTVNLNAGHVTSYGLEAELNWNVTERLNLYGSATYLHARITNQDEYVAVAGYRLPGDHIPFVPDWNFATGVNYKIPLKYDDKLTLNVNEVAKGSRRGGSLDVNSEPILKAYELTNASITFDHGGLEIAAFATNLLNKKFLENYFDKSYLSRAGFTGPLVINLSIPGERRRIGVRASVKF
jgi:iron complex outermembrane receptor protein